ncbi:MAG: hypothetical protein WC554_14580 [Clostridia bacterium]
MTQKEWVEARKTIYVDFNGVLDMYKGWKGSGHTYPMRPGTFEFLTKLHKMGYTIFVFTAADIAKVKQWLTRNGLADLIEDVTDKKGPALVYLDDRAVQFNGDYYDALDQILNFKTHWEDKDNVEGGKV